MNLKKALSLFLALCLCVSLLPVSVLANDPDPDAIMLVLDGATITNEDATQFFGADGTYYVDDDVYLIANDAADSYEWSLTVDGEPVDLDNAYVTLTDVALEGLDEVEVPLLTASNTLGRMVHVKFELASAGKNIGIKAEAKEPVTPPPAEKVTVTFKVQNGYWNDYDTDPDADITIQVNKGSELKDDDIPGVGSNPADGFKAGAWDVNPSGYTVTADTVFTYTYEEDTSEDEFTVTFKVVNGKWDDYDNADDVTITVVSGTKLGDEIPAVGSNPADGFKAGAWDVDPTDYEVTADTVFTYTYEEDETPTEVEFTVTFKVANGSWDDGTTAEKTVTLKGVEGDTLKLTADQIPAVGTKPDFGYKAGSWDVTPSTDTAITKDTVYTYTFEKDDTPYGGGGSSGTTAYKVNLPTDTKYGTITATPSSASKGTKVTLKLTPADGFTAVKPTVLDKNGNPIEVIDNGDGTYSFIMPDGDVTVKGGFKGKFVDVEPEDPFFDAVYWAAAKGITLGTDETHFSPNGPCTRAMFVTFLWRAAGQPAASTTTCQFIDVIPGEYYYDAVVWAAETGVTLGTDETHFTPDRVVTRAEAFTFVYRYEKLIGNGFTGTWAFSLNNFSDYQEVPEYAYESFCWMVKEGRIGESGQLQPNAVCPRYQIVMLLMSVFG